MGSISNAGPFTAKISFAEGLTAAWNGAPLGQIAMPQVRRAILWFREDGMILLRAG